MRRGFPQDHRFQLAQAIQGLRAQRFELINSAGEQLGQLRLGTVHPEAPLQQLQFFWGEIRGFKPVFHNDGRLLVAFRDRL